MTLIQNGVGIHQKNFIYFYRNNTSSVKWRLFIPSKRGILHFWQCHYLPINNYYKKLK